ncbi:glycosyltransferase [Flavobacterium sp. K5-23]|uniref:glycosyltransferase n=1 Tax=Flavobacterium sp. K5-23 TaxID=2746225 RepID=UPI00200EAF9B|nr:glycosyltransferase [Flavobacterium sp. K5-23]UQD56170.1 glycosyltransferase [Flavobacterium sp. K5-23]
MRVLQIIDSLEAGGAERMAVNYANALSKRVAFSGIVVTREEGPLMLFLNTNVTYFFLNKRSSFDLNALFRLKAFVLKNNINLVHAHSTSFFTAFLLKFICPSLNIIWHDHYGDSEFLHKRPSLVLKLTLPFFTGIISVNQKLKDWAKNQMRFNNSLYLPNFVSEESSIQETTILKGIDGKRIVCLANLRIQKNHFLLLAVAKRIKIVFPDWTFHLVGKDSDDFYSEKLKKIICELELKETVFIYGTRSDISSILKQSTIGILTSQSEGLPVALLEYGLHKKPVVVTDVGEVSSVIVDGSNGFIVSVGNEIIFYDALLKLIKDEILRLEFGNSLRKTIIDSYSENVVMKQYLNWLQSTIQK